MEVAVILLALPTPQEDHDLVEGGRSSAEEVEVTDDGTGATRAKGCSRMIIETAIPLAVSLLGALGIAWAILLALVLAVLVLYGERRHQLEDRRRGPPDRRHGLEDSREDPVERRAGPGDRRTGEPDRRAGGQSPRAGVRSRFPRLPRRGG